MIESDEKNRHELKHPGPSAIGDARQIQTGMDRMDRIKDLKVAGSSSFYPVYPVHPC
jgi:hypothetical protein